MFVRDRDGTHRDEYFFATQTTISVAAIIAHYTSRWSIETTFQELRCHLGLETTRGWCQKTVLRAAPCLFGLYSVVAALYQALPEAKQSGSIAWPGKATVTFSDALTSVRRWLWDEWVFRQAGLDGVLEKLREPQRGLLLAVLAPAA